MATQLDKDARQSHNEFYPDPDEWQQYAAQGTEQMREMIRDNAGRSVLIALGTGLGIGLLIGTALGGSSRSSRWWDRSTAEGLGRRMLDRFESLVPDAVSSRLHE